MVARLGVALVIMAALFVTSAAEAQLSTLRERARITIVLNPSHPGARESVRLRAVSPELDLDEADIAWYAGGRVIAQGPGAVETEIVTGALGSRIDISVYAETIEGIAGEGEATIRPAAVDLLWEADTYTPPLYRGRPLPSPGSRVRAYAVARFGTASAERDIIYTWRRNGSIVSSLSGRGKSSATFPAPAPFGSDSISVTARTADGMYEGEASAAIFSVEPLLALYPNNPIFGVMYHQMLSARSAVSDVESTFSAVPYFASGAMNDPDLRYAWRVNGTEIAADPKSPGELTVNAGGAGGAARIDLSIRSAVSWLTNLKGSWSVSFESAEKPRANFTGQ